MNAVRCNKCGDEIESKHRHDYVSCECGHVAVDGGPAYKRRCFNGEPDFTEIEECPRVRTFRREYDG